MGVAIISMNDVEDLKGSGHSIQNRTALLECVHDAVDHPVRGKIISDVFMGADPDDVSVFPYDGTAVGIGGLKAPFGPMVKRQLVGLLASSRATGARGITESVLNFSDDRMRFGPRIVVQGGHRINRIEYAFVSHLFREIAKRVREGVVITGCGDGAMQAPFEGIEQELADRDFKDAHRYVRIGLTEAGILAKERPNPLVERLVVYPDIEQRMESFIRLATLIIIVPGGVGTAEEIMQLLEVVLSPENTGKVPNTHLIEGSGGQWMNNLRELFDVCFPGLLDKSEFLRVLAGIDPATYACEVKRMKRPLWNEPWNEEITMPVESQFIHTDDPSEFFVQMEGMRLSRSENGTEAEVAGVLRRFFSAMVDLTVKHPEIVDEWKGQGQKVRLRGQQDVIVAVMKFLDLLYSQGRLHPTAPSRKDIFVW